MQVLLISYNQFVLPKWEIYKQKVPALHKVRRFHCFTHTRSDAVRTAAIQSSRIPHSICSGVRLKFIYFTMWREHESIRMMFNESFLRTYIVKEAAGSFRNCEVLCIIIIRRAFLSSALQIHETTPLSVEVLKSFGDEFIKEQHYTKRDLLDAEMVLMQVLKFEIGTSHTAFIIINELLSQLKVIARVGEHVNFEACMDILDLLYEKEVTSVLFNSPCSLAASILVVAYVISVPAQRWEFPILPWVKFVTSYKEEEILYCVRDILKHIFEPQTD